MVLAGSFPPSLPPSPNPGPARPPEYRTRAGGAPAGGGQQVRARTTALTPRTPDEPRSPRAAQAGSAQPGVLRLPGPRPLATKGSAAEPRRRPLAQLAGPRWTLKGKSPSTRCPMLAPRESRGSGWKAQGQRDPGSGPKLTRRCERRYRRWRTRRRRLRAGLARAGRSAVRAPRTAPLRLLLLLHADRGWGHRAVLALLARLAAGPLLACPPPGRSLSRAPAAARFFNVHRQ